MKAIVIAAKWLLLGLCLSAAAVLAVNLWIGVSTRRYVHDDPSELPDNKTGLLLGTSPFMKGGKRNPFFENRIDAAAQLYAKGKIKNIIVSGDNRSPYYNEPEEMRRSLMKRGVPAGRIYLDYAGLRTLDSVVRCGEMFGQKKFTVVTQRFHNLRAVFLARAKGYDAEGFNAGDVPFKESVTTRFREYFAKVEAVLDLMTYKQPLFLGEKITVK